MADAVAVAVAVACAGAGAMVNKTVVFVVRVENGLWLIDIGGASGAWGAGSGLAIGDEEICA